MNIFPKVFNFLKYMLLLVFPDPQIPYDQRKFRRDTSELRKVVKRVRACA